VARVHHQVLNHRERNARQRRRNRHSRTSIRSSSEPWEALRSGKRGEMCSLERSGGRAAGGAVRATPPFPPRCPLVDHHAAHPQRIPFAGSRWSRPVNAISDRPWRAQGSCWFRVQHSQGKGNDMSGLTSVIQLGRTQNTHSETGAPGCRQHVASGNSITCSSVAARVDRPRMARRLLVGVPGRFDEAGGTSQAATSRKAIIVAASLAVRGVWYYTAAGKKVGSRTTPQGGSRRLQSHVAHS